MSFYNPFAGGMFGGGTLWPNGFYGSGTSVYGNPSAYLGAGSGGSFMNGAMNQPWLNNLGVGPPQMGFESLPDRPEPMGIYQSYSNHPDEVVLNMRERSTSQNKDNYTITDATTGQVIFSVKGPSVSFNDKRNVFDMQGNWIYKIKRRGLPMLNDTFVGVEPVTGNTIFQVSTKGYNINTLAVNFINTAGNGERTVLHIGAMAYGTVTRFTDNNGRTVARLNRDPSGMARTFFNEQTYSISVASHVDTSLMIAIAICIDERLSRVPGMVR